MPRGIPDCERAKARLRDAPPCSSQMSCTGSLVKNKYSLNGIAQASIENENNCEKAKKCQHQGMSRKVLSGLTEE